MVAPQALASRLTEAQVAATASYSDKRFSVANSSNGSSSRPASATPISIATVDDVQRLVLAAGGYLGPGPSPSALRPPAAPSLLSPAVHRVGRASSERAKSAPEASLAGAAGEPLGASPRATPSPRQRASISRGPSSREREEGKAGSDGSGAAARPASSDTGAVSGSQATLWPQLRKSSSSSSSAAVASVGGAGGGEADVKTSPSGAGAVAESQQQLNLASALSPASSKPPGEAVAADLEADSAGVRSVARLPSEK